MSQDTENSEQASSLELIKMRAFCGNYATIQLNKSILSKMKPLFIFKK